MSACSYPFLGELCLWGVNSVVSTIVFRQRVRNILASGRRCLPQRVNSANRDLSSGFPSTIAWLAAISLFSTCPSWRCLSLAQKSVLANTHPCWLPLFICRGVDSLLPCLMVIFLSERKFAIIFIVCCIAPFFWKAARQA